MFRAFFLQRPYIPSLAQIAAHNQFPSAPPPRITRRPRGFALTAYRKAAIGSLEAGMFRITVARHAGSQPIIRVGQPCVTDFGQEHSEGNDVDQQAIKPAARRMMSLAG